MSVSPEVSAIIHRKKAQYCRFADSNQWDRFDELMLPDTTFSFCNPDGTVVDEGGVVYSWTSRAEWAAFFSKAFETQQTIHIVGPGELEQTGPEEISAIWSVVYHAGSKGPTGGFHGTGGGHYHETWVKRGDDWFMKSLTMFRLYWKIQT